LILDRIGPDEESDDSHLTQSACTLYGLIHARYIITAHGLDAMYNKVLCDRNDSCYDTCFVVFFVTKLYFPSFLIQ
jgi:casein kinase II subunit beta